MCQYSIIFEQENSLFDDSIRRHTISWWCIIFLFVICKYQIKAVYERNRKFVFSVALKCSWRERRWVWNKPVSNIYILWLFEILIIYIIVWLVVWGFYMALNAFFYHFSILCYRFALDIKYSETEYFHSLSFPHTLEILCRSIFSLCMQNGTTVCQTITDSTCTDYLFETNQDKISEAISIVCRKRVKTQ